MKDENKRELLDRNFEFHGDFGMACQKQHCPFGASIAVAYIILTCGDTCAYIKSTSLQTLDFTCQFITDETT